MPPVARPLLQRLFAAIALLAATLTVAGCAVVSVAGTAASVAAAGAGLAVDAAVGTVRITGKVVGAAADAMLPGDDGR